MSKYRPGHEFGPLLILTDIIVASSLEDVMVNTSNLELLVISYNAFYGVSHYNFQR